MERRFRLTGTSDFKRVRRYGKSYAHPLIVLLALPNELERSRFGVVAGKPVGGAVHRNRAKRQLRESLRPLLPAICPGWDIILLARKSIAQASFEQIQQALHSLLFRAGLLVESHDK